MRFLLTQSTRKISESSSFAQIQLFAFQFCVLAFITMETDAKDIRYSFHGNMPKKCPLFQKILSGMVLLMLYSRSKTLDLSISHQNILLFPTKSAFSCKSIKNQYNTIQLARESAIISQVSVFLSIRSQLAQVPNFDQERGYRPSANREHSAPQSHVLY